MNSMILSPLSSFAVKETPWSEEMLCEWRWVRHSGDFPGGPVVKNLTSNGGDSGSITGQGN